MGLCEFEIEIFEGYGGKLQKDKNGKVIYPEDLAKEKICAWMYRGDGESSYKLGQIFKYPEESGKLCPWISNSVHEVFQVLRFGGNILWDYKNTPYEKEINRNGITTEYIRCIDPTESGIVLKFIRKENP